ncbi:hypothetical protein D910_06281, partial [Dendroctonus ponderosae]
CYLIGSYHLHALIQYPRLFIFSDDLISSLDLTMLVTMKLSLFQSVIFVLSFRIYATVKVSVFYETLCPDCIAFITNQLHPNYKAFGSSLIDLQLIPCGFEHCASSNQISWPDIEMCISSIAGEKIMEANEKITAQLNPRSVPTVVFNGGFNENDANQSIDDLKGVICKYLNNNPPQCRSNINPSIIVL